MNRKEEILILIEKLTLKIEKNSKALSTYGDIDNIADENNKILELSRHLADYIHEYKTLK